MESSYILSLILASSLGLYVFSLSYIHFSDLNYYINYKDWYKILIFSVLTTINSLYSPVYLSAPLSLVLYLVLFALLFKESFSKKFYLTLYICLLSLIADFILLIFFESFFNEFYNYYSNKIIFKTFFSIMFAYIYYFIYKLNFFKVGYKKLYKLFERKRQTIIIPFLIFSLIVLLCTFFSNKTNFSSIYMIGFLELMIVIGISFFYFKEAKINLDLRIKNNYLKENKILYNQNIEEYQLLKHNLINDLTFIKSLCPDNVQEIINEKIKKFVNKNDILTNIKNVPEGLQGIIYIKSRVAKHKNINFYVDNENMVELNFNNKKYCIEVCEILSELLDNAIEATNKTNNKVAYINFLKDKKYIRIQIINTFSNEINLNKIGTKHYSTKKDGKGIGLYYILNLNKNIKISSKIIDKLYVTEVKLNLKHILIK